MSDEQYHEFHLEGKQLVFLFMAALVVVVVSFLFGVMVGRGVEMPASQAETLAESGEAEDPTFLDETADGAPEGDAAAVPSTGGPEPLTYFERLNSTTPVPEPIIREVPRPEPANPAAASPVSEPVPPPAATPPAAQAERQAAEPVRPAQREPAPAARAGTATGSGFAVQVISTANRAGAESEARKLASKGYPSFVEPSGNGQYRVRVGRYADRREAEAVARRLEREENYKGPWISR